ncbi:MAG TPA: hypothetical protein VHK91_16640 [Flavisolibacter sp.]|nr:hypothetical protein [Flavisolibacter sp.]
MAIPVVALSGKKYGFALSGEKATVHKATSAPNKTVLTYKA